jgi:hypothetical protein
LIADALAANDPNDENEQALRQLVQGEEGAPVNSALQAALRSRLTKENLLAFFRESYQVNPNLSPQTTLKTLSRSTRVVGEILEDVADDYGKIGQRPATWMARFGRVFWGLVEVSIPRSIQGEFFRYWLVILYLFEALLIAVGTIFVREQVQALGVVALGATAVIHFSTLLLRDYMVGKSTWLRILIVASVFALLFFAVVGADTLFDLRTRLLGFLSDG